MYSKGILAADTICFYLLLLFITFIYTDKVLALKSTSLHSLPVCGNHLNSDIISVIYKL